MRKVSSKHWANLLSYLYLLVTIFILVGCGGGGGGDSQSQSQSQSSSSLPTSSTSSATKNVKLSGRITYDYIPHNSNFIGLNYAAVEQRPIRGAVVELIDSSGKINATTTSTDDGVFSMAVQQNFDVKVRVKAQLLHRSSPSWDFKVTDNTSNDALYVMDGALVSSGNTDSVRNLHAGSGWGGSSYTTTRSAAPFAILDNIYTGIARLTNAGNTTNLRPLDLHWSTKNSVADGEYEKGEIGTSFYDGSAIYILGDADNDIDEYDPHVLLHEWGHYIEDELFRSDSIGGDHADGKFLDIRVAMSEGFANAFSGMMIDTANYSDASGAAQSSGFTFDIARKSRPNKGYFSEGSIGSIFYNFYNSSENKIANDFAPIFKVLNNISYYKNDAVTSIYLFYSQLKNQFPQYLPPLQTLMHEQTIWGDDEYATNESNSGGLAIQLPIYKIISVNYTPLTVCGSNQYGELNKLGNSQFVRLSITQAGFYVLNVSKSIDSNALSNPEFILYLKDKQINYSYENLNGNISSRMNLMPGNYVLEIYDRNHRDGERLSDKTTSCFDVSVMSN